MSRIQQALSRVSSPIDEPVDLEGPVTQQLPAIAPPDIGPHVVEPSVATPVQAGLPAATRAAFDTNERLVVNAAMAPDAREEYRKLAAELQRLTGERKTSVVMVASATDGEGKTVTAVNLALTLSESFHRRVLLIDADMRQPAIHRAFHLENAAGLNEGLTADGDRKLAVVAVSPFLTVLPAGGVNADPMGVLTSARMRDIVESASASFDWVVIDTPPIGILPDANVLAQMADMVLLVVAAGATSFRLVQRAVKGMDRTRIAGVVLNRMARSQARHGYLKTAAATR